MPSIVFHGRPVELSAKVDRHFYPSTDMYENSNDNGAAFELRRSGIADHVEIVRRSVRTPSPYRTIQTEDVPNELLSYSVAQSLLDKGAISCVNPRHRDMLSSRNFSDPRDHLIGAEFFRYLEERSLSWNQIQYDTRLLTRIVRAATESFMLEPETAIMLNRVFGAGLDPSLAGPDLGVYEPVRASESVQSEFTLDPSQYDIPELADDIASNQLFQADYQNYAPLNNGAFNPGWENDLTRDLDARTFSYGDLAYRHPPQPSPQFDTPGQGVWDELEPSASSWNEGPHYDQYFRTPDRDLY